VFVGYASQKGYTLLHRRLYLPEEWLSEEAFRERRIRCAIPPETEFATKPELALEMLGEVVAAGSLRSRWVAADEAFGRDTAFLDGVQELGLWYFVEVPHDTQVWLERPLVGVPEWSGRGRKPQKERVLEEVKGQQWVAVLAQQLEASDWQLRVIEEGSQGPQEAGFASRRVWGVREGLPGPEVWLVWRRHPLSGELKTYLSNAPAETTEMELIRMSGMRWPVEMCFEEAKQLLGMGSYEVRSWKGWHHHQTLVILAHFFVVRTSRVLKKKRHR
jgi:SRSO17 transposase